MKKAEVNIQAALAAGVQALSASDSPRLDAETLLANALGKPRVYCHTWPERLVTPSVLEKYHAWIQRRAQGEPVAYILGQKEFWSLPFKITRETLIPRPDTELLVSLCLQHLPPNEPCHVLDLGTGSGAIACALAHERPHWQLDAIDKSPAALDVARQNAQNLKLNNIRFYPSHWLQQCEKSTPYHAIVANPPYIAPNESSQLARDLSYEPSSALFSHEEGMADLNEIIASAPPFLREQGYLLLEHGYQQAEKVQKTLAEKGYHAIKNHHDLAYQARVTLARKPT